MWRPNGPPILIEQTKKEFSFERGFQTKGRSKSMCWVHDSDHAIVRVKKSAAPACQRQVQAGHGSRSNHKTDSTRGVGSWQAQYTLYLSIYIYIRTIYIYIYIYTHTLYIYIYYISIAFPFSLYYKKMGYIICCKFFSKRGPFLFFEYWALNLRILLGICEFVVGLGFGNQIILVFDG